jgi:hypothetical protein
MVFAEQLDLAALDQLPEGGPVERAGGYLATSSRTEEQRSAAGQWNLEGFRCSIDDAAHGWFSRSAAVQGDYPGPRYDSNVLSAVAYGQDERHSAFARRILGSTLTTAPSCAPESDSDPIGRAAMLS